MKITKKSKHGDNIIPIHMSAEVDDYGLCLVGNVAEAIYDMEQFSDYYKDRFRVRLNGIIFKSIWTELYSTIYEYYYGLVEHDDIASHVSDSKMANIQAAEIIEILKDKRFYVDQKNKLNIEILK